MTTGKSIIFLTLVFIAASLAVYGSSFAAVTRGSGPFDHMERTWTEWGWTNPLDGVPYKMSQYADGTIVAINHWKSPTGNPRDPYRSFPGVLYQGETTDQYIDLSETARVVYYWWKNGKLSCTVTRNVPDLFGNTTKVCQVAPFNFKIAEGILYKAKDGVVWIITPPASAGKQEPATGGSLPSWGR